MKDELGDRIKEQYENRTRIMLPRRTYTIIRCDGRAFHTFTKKMQKPFDAKFAECMNAATKALCEGVMGSVIGYVQSDEISLILTDFAKDTSEAFFDGNLQKIASITASKATAYFNQRFYSQYGDISTAEFDSRVFTIPDPAEVINYLIWRQNDATRNSIQMVAQSLYGHKELQGKQWDELNELIFQKGVNYNAYSSHFKRGRVITKVTVPKEFIHPKTGESSTVMRSSWEVMPETPWFTKDMEFLKNLIPRYT